MQWRVLYQLWALTMPLFIHCITVNDNSNIDGSMRMVPDNEEDEESGTSAKRVVNFASISAGAVVLEASPKATGYHNLLNDDKDKYGISPCAEKKWVVIGLSEDIVIEDIVLSNYEKYSSSLRDFQVLGSTSYPVSEWMDLGTFSAAPDLGDQSFEITTPSWGRYLKFRFLTHHGDEFYCTLSQIRVHGSTVIENLKKEVERSTLEALDLHVIFDDDSEYSDSTSGSGVDLGSGIPDSSNSDITVTIEGPVNMSDSILTIDSSIHSETHSQDTGETVETKMCGDDSVQNDVQLNESLHRNFTEIDCTAPTSEPCSVLNTTNNSSSVVGSTSVTDETELTSSQDSAAESTSSSSIDETHENIVDVKAEVTGSPVVLESAAPETVVDGSSSVTENPSDGASDNSKGSHLEASDDPSHSLDTDTTVECNKDESCAGVSGSYNDGSSVTPETNEVTPLPNSDSQPPSNIIDVDTSGNDTMKEYLVDHSNVSDSKGIGSDDNNVESDRLLNGEENMNELSSVQSPVSGDDSGSGNEKGCTERSVDDTALQADVQLCTSVDEKRTITDSDKNLTTVQLLENTSEVNISHNLAQNSNDSTSRMHAMQNSLDSDEVDKLGNIPSVAPNEEPSKITLQPIFRAAKSFLKGTGGAVDSEVFESTNGELPTEPKVASEGADDDTVNTDQDVRVNSTSSQEASSNNSDALLNSTPNHTISIVSESSDGVANSSTRQSERQKIGDLDESEHENRKSVTSNSSLNVEPIDSDAPNLLQTVDTHCPPTGTIPGDTSKYDDITPPTIATLVATEDDSGSTTTPANILSNSSIFNNSKDSLQNSLSGFDRTFDENFTVLLPNTTGETIPMNSSGPHSLVSSAEENSTNKTVLHNTTSSGSNSSMNNATGTYSKPRSAASCFDSLRFPEFQAKMRAKLAAGGGNQQGNNGVDGWGGPSSQDVFRVLMQKITSLEQNYKIIELYTIQISECYQLLYREVEGSSSSDFKRNEEISKQYAAVLNTLASLPLEWRTDHSTEKIEEAQSNELQEKSISSQHQENILLEDSPISSPTSSHCEVEEKVVQSSRLNYILSNCVVALLKSLYGREVNITEISDDMLLKGVVITISIAGLSVLLSLLCCAIVIAVSFAPRNSKY